MNDRFKFRAWDKINDEWVKIPHLSLDVETGMLNGFFDYTEAVKRRYTLEQCTGLKDKNGKLIYEGDILDFDLSTPRNGGHYRGFIRWEEYNEIIGWVISDMDMAGEWDLRQIAHPNDWMVWGEIIGNIHENADLLEVEND